MTDEAMDQSDVLLSFLLGWIVGTTTTITTTTIITEASIARPSTTVSIALGSTSSSSTWYVYYIYHPPPAPRPSIENGYSTDKKTLSTNVHVRATEFLSLLQMRRYLYSERIFYGVHVL